MVGLEAVSDPSDVIFSAPLRGRPIDLSIKSYSFLTTVRRDGGEVDPSKRFLNLVD